LNQYMCDRCEGRGYIRGWLFGRQVCPKCDGLPSFQLPLRSEHTPPPPRPEYYYPPPPPPPRPKRRPTEPDIVVIREGDSKPVEKREWGLSLRAPALDALDVEMWRYRHALALLANDLAKREGSPRVYSGHIRQAAEQLRCIPAEPPDAAEARTRVAES